MFYRQFIKEKLPPIQYNNPSVQVVLFKNTGKPPFVNIFFGEPNSDIQLANVSFVPIVDDPYMYIQ